MQNKWFLWLLSPLSDIVKSPKVTTQKRMIMSQQNKPQSESKPQQPATPKPVPSQSTADFATKRVFVGDSADSVKEYLKKQQK
jgi:hypothetical protein